jgi:predicted porin
VAAAAVARSLERCTQYQNIWSGLSSGQTGIAGIDDGLTKIDGHRRLSNLFYKHVGIRLMNKTFYSTIGFGLMLCCVETAIAQETSATSSVTLYGIIDNGIAYINHQAPNSTSASHSVIKSASQVMSGNRWGLRGVERLSTSLSAIFTLENGFDGQGGAALQGGRMFGRQAFVGLSSTEWGTLTMGRQYDTILDYVSSMAAWTQLGSSYGAHIGDNDNMFNTWRENNSIKFRSIDYAGFTAGGTYAFSNAPGQFANNRAYSLGAQYIHGPFKAAMSYLHLNSPSSGQAGGTNPNGAVGGEYGTGPGSIFYANFVDRQSVLVVGSEYQSGPGLFHLIYSNTRLDYKDHTSLRLNNVEANVVYKILPAVTVTGAYIYTTGRGEGGMSLGRFATGNHPQWHQFEVGTSYAFSARTDVYAAAIYQLAAGDATLAALNLQGGVSGIDHHSVLLTVAGIRHRF